MVNGSPGRAGTASGTSDSASDVPASRARVAATSTPATSCMAAARAWDLSTAVKAGVNMAEKMPGRRDLISSSI